MRDPITRLLAAAQAPAIDTKPSRLRKHKFGRSQSAPEIASIKGILQLSQAFSAGQAAAQKHESFGQQYPILALHLLRSAGDLE